MTSPGPGPKDPRKQPHAEPGSPTHQPWLRRSAKGPLRPRRRFDRRTSLMVFIALVAVAAIAAAAYVAAQQPETPQRQAAAPDAEVLPPTLAQPPTTPSSDPNTERIKQPNTPGPARIIDPNQAIIHAFASCNGTYHSEQYRNRAAVANAALTRGTRDVDQLAQLTTELCPPVAPTRVTDPVTRPFTTVPAPSQIDLPAHAFILAWATCADRYRGEQQAQRYQATQEAVDHGRLSMADLKQAIADSCPTAEADPNARQPTPTPWQPAGPTAAAPRPSPSAPIRPTPVTAALSAKTPAPSTATDPTRPLLAPPPTLYPANQSPTEFHHLTNANWLLTAHPDLARGIRTLPWIADGLTDLEAKIAQSLIYIASGRNPEHARALLAMPFLATPDPDDRNALHDLEQTSVRNPVVFAQIMAHPTVSAGITDQWTPVIATLSSPAAFDPASINRLLNPELVTLETRNIQLPETKEVRLRIVRTAPGAKRTIELLHRSAAFNESVLQQPLPNRSLIVLITTAVKPGYAGHNSASHISLQPSFDVPSQDTSPRSNPYDDSQTAQRIMTHEVAHHLWSGNQAWIDEGLAEYTAAAHLAQLTGQPLSASNHPCIPAEYISQIENAPTAPESPTHTCAYSLGERVFIELSQATSPAIFQERLRQLLQLNQDLRNRGHPDGKLDSTHITRIFSRCSETEAVLQRWFTGAQPHRAPPELATPATPYLSSLNARVTGYHITGYANGVAAEPIPSSLSRQQLYLQLEILQPDTQQPITARLTLNLRYQDGHSFHRREVPISISGARQTVAYSIPLPRNTWPPGTWRPGKYTVTLHDGPSKALQHQFTVTP